MAARKEVFYRKSRVPRRWRFKDDIKPGRKYNWDELFSGEFMTVPEDIYHPTSQTYFVSLVYQTAARMGISVTVQAYQNHVDIIAFEGE